MTTRTGFYYLNNGTYIDICNNFSSVTSQSSDFFSNYFLNLTDITRYYSINSNLNSNITNTNYIIVGNTNYYCGNLQIDYFFNQYCTLSTTGNSLTIFKTMDIRVNQDNIYCVIAVGGGGGGGGGGGANGGGDIYRNYGGAGGGIVACIVKLRANTTYTATIGPKSNGNFNKIITYNGNNTILRSVENSNLYIDASGGGGSGGSNSFNTNAALRGKAGTGSANGIDIINKLILSGGTSSTTNSITTGNQGISLSTTTSNSLNLKILNSMYNDLSLNEIIFYPLYSFCSGGGNATGINSTNSTVNGTNIGNGGNGLSGGTNTTVGTDIINGTDGNYGCGGGGGKSVQTGGPSYGGKGGQGFMYLYKLPMNRLNSIDINGAYDISGDLLYSGLTYCIKETTDTTGTLYTFTSSGSFTLKTGSMKCYALCIGPGGYGSVSPQYTSGAGGGGALAYFTLSTDVVYNIEINSGTNNTTNGTTVQGYSRITSSDNSIIIDASGGNINTLATSVSPTVPGGNSSVTGTATYVCYSGGNGNLNTNSSSYPNNSGYTFSSSESGFTSISSNSNFASYFLDMSNKIANNNFTYALNSITNNWLSGTTGGGSASQISGFTSDNTAGYGSAGSKFGFGSSGTGPLFPGGTGGGVGGIGGIYNKSLPLTILTSTKTNFPATNGLGYGTGGGSGIIKNSITRPGGNGGIGAVFIYFNSSI